MAKGSAGDIATLGVAGIAIYFIYTLIKGNSVTQASPLQSAVNAVIAASKTDVTSSPSPTGYIPLVPVPSLSPTQTVDPSHTAFQIPTVAPVPVPPLPNATDGHDPYAIANDAVNTGKSLWSELSLGGMIP